MGNKIRIKAASVEATAELNDTETAGAIWDALPITGIANTWGDEIYFSIPPDIEPENGREVVESGDIAYWPPGNAFCIFFGPTPASRGDEVRAASAVNVFGRITGDATVFRRVVSGTAVTVEKEDG